MSLYSEVISELRDKNSIRELYRFQGANSFGYYNIRTSTFEGTPNDNYVYLSGSLDHHEYFSVKRIKQLINSEVLKDTPYTISSKDLRDMESYPIIKNLVLNNERLTDLYSVRLITASSAIRLMRENSFLNCKKPEEKAVERVDRRVYGGGYGVSAEWKDLLLNLTYFDGYQRIDKDSIINLLATMKATGRINNKDNIDFILGNPEYYSYGMSPGLQNPFTKYDIMNALERILEKGTYSETSELGERPKETIRKVVDNYERGKGKVLTLLESHYKSESE